MCGVGPLPAMHSEHEGVRKSDCLFEQKTSPATVVFGHRFSAGADQPGTRGDRHRSNRFAVAWNSPVVVLPIDCRWRAFGRPGETTDCSERNWRGVVGALAPSTAAISTSFAEAGIEARHPRRSRNRAQVPRRAPTNTTEIPRAFRKSALGHASPAL